MAHLSFFLYMHVFWFIFIYFFLYFYMHKTEINQIIICSLFKISLKKKIIKLLFGAMNLPNLIERWKQNPSDQFSDILAREITILEPWYSKYSRAPMEEQLTVRIVPVAFAIFSCNPQFNGGIRVFSCEMRRLEKLCVLNILTSHMQKNELASKEGR